ncbi:MAG: molecular chaperone HtpG [Planctomycetes bacterium]|nr:molecular chaperone HtpG [Planctomycetota bacterium]
MAETMQFKTELKQLLNLIIHSLYSHKDIFLRELISNASDAIDRVRFQGLTDASVLEDNSDWKIKLIPNAAEGTLTISDNGVGMSRETIVEHLGTIARSGTREFLDSLRAADAKDRPELIGQFGVGFYASFMVADRVKVVSRMAETSPLPASGEGPGLRGTTGVKWVSEGQGDFTIEPCTKPTRGTDVILHLRDDCKDFLNQNRLHQLVKKYSDFVEHPIVMDIENDGTTVEDVLNARKAIWLRNKNEISEEEYTEFYKHLAHDMNPPARTIHYKAEGQIEFKALLYVPAKKPFDMMWGESKKGLHLYIQRVFILDDCETLLPPYLRFVRGVVDSPTLPLNVSREILQQSAPLEKIKSNLTSKVLNTLEEMKRNDFEKYVDFYRELGVFLREGAYQDFENKKKLAELLLFESTKTDAGKLTSFADYAERMPGDQTDVYYLAGESREVLEQSPLLESFKAKGWEVLFLTDPADEFVVDSLHEYKGKHLKAIDKAGVETGAVSDEVKARFQPLCDYFKEKLADIADARLTNRLKESAVCLVADEHALSASMERLMQRMQRDRPMPVAKRILEVNPDHPLVQALEKMLADDKNDPRLEKRARLLYDQAVILEGSKVKDPLAFAQRLNELLLGSATV